MIHGNDLLGAFVVTPKHSLPFLPVLIFVISIGLFRMGLANRDVRGSRQMPGFLGQAAFLTPRR
jgi:hypothetical protein